MDAGHIEYETYVLNTRSHVPTLMLLLPHKLAYHHIHKADGLAPSFHCAEFLHTLYEFTNSRKHVQDVVELST